ncbi:MAG: hypothetical protein AB7O39_04975 [Flavobacteriaceae bacterium]
MNRTQRETRLQVMLEDAELAAIDDWRFKHRMPSRAAAIRRLLKIGLQAAVLDADPARRSQDFGLLPDGMDENAEN